MDPDAVPGGWPVRPSRGHSPSASITISISSHIWYAELSRSTVVLIAGVDRTIAVVTCGGSMAAELPNRDNVPVREEAKWLGLFPKRTVRAYLFTLFSAVTLLGVLCWQLRQQWAKLQHESPYDVVADAPMVADALGRGKEVFVLLAGAAVRSPENYEHFEDTVAKLSLKAGTFQREARILAFQSSSPPFSHLSSLYSAEMQALAGKLGHRMNVVCDSERLRTMLCGVLPDVSALQEQGLCAPTEDAAARKPDGRIQRGGSAVRCTNASYATQVLSAEAMASVRDQLSAALVEPLGQPQPAVLAEGGVSEPGSPAEGEAAGAAVLGSNNPEGGKRLEAVAPLRRPRNMLAERSRHLNWQGYELLRLIRMLRQPAHAPDGVAVGVNASADDVSALELNVKHARTVRRLARELHDCSPYVSIALALWVILFWHRIWVGRQYALGRGRLRGSVVVYVFLMLQIYNIILTSAYLSEPAQVTDEPLSAKTAFTMTTYSTAVQEIRYRLEQEQDFYILKFTMIGSLLAVFFRFLLSNDESSGGGRAKDAIDKLRASKIAAFFFWAAVIVNCIVDTRMRYNSVICIALGSWIRSLELALDEPALPGWETFFYQQAPISSSPLMQLAPTLLTTIVFVLTVVLFVCKERGDVTIRGHSSDSLEQVNLVFGSISFAIIAVSSLGVPGMVWQWCGPVLGWVLAGMLVLRWGPKALRNRVFRGAEITESVIGHAFPFHYIDMHSTWMPWPDNTGRLWACINRFTDFVFVSLGSYVPLLRNFIVRKTREYLSIELKYLEESADPPLSAIVVQEEDGSLRPEAQARAWSVLYLLAGSRGRDRIKDGATVDMTSDQRPETQLVTRWLEGNGQFLRRDSDGFRVWGPRWLIRPNGKRVEYVSCKSISYSLIRDYYEKHNPWVLVVCELGWGSDEDKAEGQRKSEGGKELTPFVLISFKDVENQARGNAGGRIAPPSPRRYHAKEGEDRGRRERVLPQQARLVTPVAGPTKSRDTSKRTRGSF